MDSPDESSPEEVATSAPSVPGGTQADSGTTSAPEVRDPGAEEPLETPSVVVGIGASAGGLEALSVLAGRLRRGNMAFVVVQHLARGHDSALAQLLARVTALKIVSASDGMRLEANTIYVAPADVILELRQGRFQLLPDDHRLLPRHTIDAFFRSLAADRGPESIAVVLSGAGSDGTFGARAVREAGGITFAQEPSTAKHASMPESMIAAGLADYTLSPAQIGDELVRLSAHPFAAGTPRRTLVGADFREHVFERLYRAFDVDFRRYKLATVERRLERRMALRKIERAEDYLGLLDADPQELRSLHEDLLIGVTSFFRDDEPFVELTNTIFPRLLEGRGTAVPIRIWVAGCATGEEAYSVLICLLEFLEGRASGYSVQVFATDLDESALARARSGFYPRSIELDVSAARLQRFFTREEDGYRVAQSVRDKVLFARHNLDKDPPFSRLDLISCRNVLIYLQPTLQKQILRVFHYALNPEGILLLGSSESVGDSPDMFVLLDRQLKLYAKKSVASRAAYELSSASQRREEGSLHGASPPSERDVLTTLQQVADRAVLEKFGPPGLLVDSKLNVIQFRGQTGPYLGPPAGLATLHVLKLVRAELLVELRLALQKAAETRSAVWTPSVELWGTDGPRTVSVEVLPLLMHSGPHEQCMLLLFRDSTTTAERAQTEPAVRAHEPRTHEQQALERELLVTREYLQTTVRELELANEELQGANEELQSSNEELQSTNEELETSKEELQSTNEELASVNEELLSRMQELAVSNDDLQKLQGNLSLPFVLVGVDRRIRSYSAAAEKWLRLSAQDIGQPVSRLEAKLNLGQLEDGIADVLQSHREAARRFRAPDGAWYSMRTTACLTSEPVADAVLLEFTRSAPPRVNVEGVEIHELVGKVLSTLPHVLMLVDEHLRLVWVNKAFFDEFRVGAEVIGHALEEVFPGAADDKVLLDALQETAANGTPFAEQVVARPFGVRATHPLKFLARWLPRDDDRPVLTLVLMEELP